MSSQIRVAAPSPGTLEVTAESFGDFVATFSDRLSRDGVLIPDAPDLPRGSEVSLQFRLADGFSVLEAMGLVSEPKALGLGVHFLVIQSGGELVDKLVGDHLAEGGQPFLVDSAAALADAQVVEPAPRDEPRSGAEPVETEPEEPAEAEEPVRELLVDSTKPAFAPGMVRLDGEGEHEREALSGLGSIDMQSKPLEGLGEAARTQKISLPPEEKVVFQTDGEAQSELEAAVRAMDPEAAGAIDPSLGGQQAEVKAPASSSDAPGTPDAPPSVSTAATEGLEPADLAHLSDDEFADEIDGALDSAFGSEVDAALDAAFGPTESNAETSASLMASGGLADEAPEALDASTRMVKIPDLTEPAPEPPAGVPGANDLGSAAAAAADLLGSSPKLDPDLAAI